MYWIGDIFEDALNPFLPEIKSFSSRHRFVNEDEFEIRPRKSHIEKRLACNEEEIKNLERQRKMMNDFYDTKIKQTLEEKEKWLKRLKDAG